MKWLLILVLVCVIMLIAKGLSKQYIDRFDFYYNLKQFLVNFKLNVSFKQTKILEHLNTLNCKKHFKLFIDDYKFYLKENVLDLSNISLLEEQERKDLELIITSIGKLDSENEISQIESFLASVQLKVDKAERDKLKLSPMILKLSFLFAIGLAILLI